MHNYLLLIPTSVDGTRENPSSLDAERPSRQLQLRTDAASTSQMDVQVVPVPDPWELVRADRPTMSTEGLEKPKKKT